MADKENVNKQASSLQNAPSLETLMSQLTQMERIETEIRQRWQEVNYGMLQETTPKKLTRQFQLRDPTTNPSPIAFTKQKNSGKDTTPKKIVRFVKDDNLNEQIQVYEESMIKKKPVKQFQNLSLPQSSLNAINKGKEDFQRHLKTTFHESKAGFDPWKIVEDLSDEIMEELLSNVNEEIDGLVDEFAEHVFQDEFAGNSSPNSVESSLLTSAESSSLSLAENLAKSFQ